MGFGLEIGKKASDAETQNIELRQEMTNHIRRIEKQFQRFWTLKTQTRKLKQQMTLHIMSIIEDVKRATGASFPQSRRVIISHYGGHCPNRDMR